MKKRTCKLLTALLAASLLSSMTSMSVFAANTKVTTWNGSDYTDDNPGTAQKTKKTITVKNVNDTTEGLKVCAYQIVKGVYVDGKLADYTLCGGLTETDDIADKSNPKSNEILALSKKVAANQTNLTYIEMTKGEADADGNIDYTASVEAGLYLVLVTGSGTTIYNPAIVAVNVTDANLIGESFATGGTVDMKNYFTYKVAGAGDTLVDTTTFVKSSESGLNKVIMDGDTAQKGDTAFYGQTVNFKINQMTIPYYTDYYDIDLEYKITDALDPDGFAGINNLVVTAGEDADNLVEVPFYEVVDHDDDSTTPDQKTDYYTVTYKDKDDRVLDDHFDIATNAVKFEVSFSDYFIKHNPTKAVEITYSSAIKKGAKVNYAEHMNEAELSYSNDPKDESKKTTKKSRTYHYTFGIDADLDGQAVETITTYELNKVTKANTIDTETRKSTSPLKDAEFTLYSTNTNGTLSDVVTYTGTNGVAKSDANGHIQFLGLDAGTYYMSETKVPQGYYGNKKYYKIVISAENDAATGVLTSYSVEISESEINKTDFTVLKTSTYTNDTADTTNFKINNDGTVTNKIITVEHPVEIVNPQTAELPSTGGIGTIIITVIAGAGMAIFLTVFIISRKKKENSESDS